MTDTLYGREAAEEARHRSLEDKLEDAEATIARLTRLIEDRSPYHWSGAATFLGLAKSPPPERERSMGKRKLIAVDCVMGLGYTRTGEEIRLPWPNVVREGDEVDEDGMPVVPKEEFTRRLRQIEQPRRCSPTVVIK